MTMEHVGTGFKAMSKMKILSLSTHPHAVFFSSVEYTEFFVTSAAALEQLSSKYDANLNVSKWQNFNFGAKMAI